MITAANSSRTMKRTHPGNRRGHSPARMVGYDLASKKRQSGRDAALVTVIGEDVHGRTSSHFFYLIVLCFIFSSQVLYGKNIPGTYTGEATPEELAAARGVESLFMDLMIQEMRKTVPENDIIPISNGEKIYRQMLDQEYAKMLSHSGGVGIAEMVLAELKRKR